MLSLFSSEHAIRRPPAPAASDAEPEPDVETRDVRGANHRGLGRWIRPPQHEMDDEGSATPPGSPARRKVIAPKDTATTAIRQPVQEIEPRR